MYRLLVVYLPTLVCLISGPAAVFAQTVGVSPAPSAASVSASASSAASALSARPASGSETRASSAPAIDPATLHELRDELAQLRAELDALKRTLASGSSNGGVTTLAGPRAGAEGVITAAASASASALPQEPRQAAIPLADTVALLQSQVQELAQVKVESGSRLPVTLSGAIVSNTFFNSGEANWLENPNLVNAAPGPGGHTGSFSSTLRQTRLGVAVQGPALGTLRTHGLVALDFFGGAPNFKTGQVIGLPRLLYAFARIEGERTALEVGQDHMILAPREPTSLAAQSFPGLFRSGNLYLRAPQIRVERTFAGGLSLAGGILAPIAGDFSETDYVFVPPAGAGERSRLPAVQARAGWRRGDSDADAPHVDLGVSGHYGREQLADRRDASWAAAIDFDLQGARLGVGGEFFYGDRLAQFGGALGQRAKSGGGFAEARLTVSRRVAVNGGAGFDRIPDDAFVALPRRENRSLFGNVIVHVTPELAMSLEYRWLSTWFDDVVGRRTNHHVNWVMVHRF